MEIDLTLAMIWIKNVIEISFEFNRFNMGISIRQILKLNSLELHA